MSEEDHKNFEEALSKLEEVVEKLEDDDIALEDSIDLYEEGIELSDYCSQTLEDAELRIKKVAEEQSGDGK